jgi:cellulose synthase/poly-beta-1,6-N-acetylglucosamine synthase-like glycosyltransferase
MSCPNIEDNDFISTIIEECPTTNYPGDIGSFHRQSEGVRVHIQYNTKKNNYGVVGSYQRLYEETTADILFYVHDDVEVFEQWDQRILKEFENPEVGVVGFGGGRDHGHPDIYKRPYDYKQLARFRYVSNVRDAEVHGARFSGSTDVSVIDGFAFAVRRELLDKCGGWPTTTPVDYLCYDYWLSCMAHRFGYRIKVVGIDCIHHGGRTFVKLGAGFDPKYMEAHEYIYKTFADVLPWECK